MKEFEAKWPVPNFVYRMIGMFGWYLDTRTEFLEEVTASAEGLDLLWGKVYMINFIYELFAGCTSIIAETSDGQIIHGRGNDYTFNDNFAGLA